MLTCVVSTFSAIAQAKVGTVRGNNIDWAAWVMHDWVRLDTAAIRLHHYRLRSREWMLKVKLVPSAPQPSFLQCLKPA